MKWNKRNGKKRRNEIRLRTIAYKFHKKGMKTRDIFDEMFYMESINMGVDQ